MIPPRARDFAARRTTPKYVLGAMCRLERDDGRILLVKPTYRSVWTLPGGLTTKGESPLDCMHRELLEETGLRCEVVGEPLVLIALRDRVIDFVYHARLAEGASPESARAVSLEIGEVGWYEPTATEAVTGEFGNRVLGSASPSDVMRLVVVPRERPGRRRKRTR